MLVFSVIHSDLDNYYARAPTKRQTLQTPMMNRKRRKEREREKRKKRPTPCHRCVQCKCEMTRLKYRLFGEVSQTSWEEKNRFIEEVLLPIALSNISNHHPYRENERSVPYCDVEISIYVYEALLPKRSLSSWSVDLRLFYHLLSMLIEWWWCHRAVEAMVHHPLAQEQDNHCSFECVPKYSPSFCFRSAFPNLWRSYMSTLGQSNCWSHSRLNLSEMNNPCHTDNFQHAIVMRWTTEFLIFLMSPKIGTTGPTRTKWSVSTCEQGSLPRCTWEYSWWWCLPTMADRHVFHRLRE